MSFKGKVTALNGAVALYFAYFCQILQLDEVERAEKVVVGLEGDETRQFRCDREVSQSVS